MQSVEARTQICKFPVMQIYKQTAVVLFYTSDVFLRTYCLNLNKETQYVKSVVHNLRNQHRCILCKC